MKNSKRLRAIFLSLALSLGFIVSVSAYYGQTQITEKTVLGLKYQFYNTINTQPYSSGGSDASTLTSCTAVNGTLDGYMGVQAHMFISDGSLLLSSALKYSTSNSVSSYHTTYFVGGDGVYVFGKGTVKLWNGSNYNTYDTGRTPNVLVRSAVVADPILMNENGQTYGSSFYIDDPEDMPDLISAVGTDGTRGYVYANDLFSVGSIASPDEANNEIVIPTSIPLYLSDGVTVIGEYPIVAE